MKYSYNVFFIILWGLFISCSSDDPAVDSNEGKDDKEDPLPDKGTLFADFETYDTTPYFFRYGNSGSFSETVDIDELRGIRFRIYQPANVIGKETWKGTSKAVSQQLGVKLIGRFNSVNDYEQEEGVLLTNSLVDFKEEGAWKTYTFVFSKREYSAAATQLKNGIAGIVILPTYSSGVTLAEGNKYKCYIDDIEIL